MKRVSFLIVGLALLILPHPASTQCTFPQKLGSDHRVTYDANHSYDPSLAWTGSEFGVSLDDYRDGNSEIYFARIGCGIGCYVCNLTSLDIIPVASLLGGTFNLAEGDTITFTAACTYAGSSCGVFSDDCTYARGVYWQYSGQVSLSTPGPSTSTIATANQIPGPNFGSGQVSGSANLIGQGNFYDSTNITVTNDNTISSVILTPVGPLNQQTGSTVNFYCVGTWGDGATKSESNPQGYPPFYSLPTNGSAGSINSATGLYTVGATAPSTDVARCTISGLSDGTTVSVTACFPGDSDCDGMPDAWEAAYPACMHPTEYDDPLADFDGDGLANIDEYYNNWDDNVSDPCDDSKPKIGRPGKGFFGDADGSLSVGGPDLDQLALVLSGNSPSYERVYPPDQMVQDYDGSGSIGGPDLDYLRAMLSGNVVLPSFGPTTLSQVLPVGVPSIQIGRTVAIKVKLTNIGRLERPGFGVVFRVMSQGSATLYGGEGWGSEPGSRYDLTNVNGEARMVLKVGAAGRILVHVELPAADPVHDLMNWAAVVLPSAVEITGIP